MEITTILITLAFGLAVGFIAAKQYFMRDINNIREKNSNLEKEKFNLEKENTRLITIREENIKNAANIFENMQKNLEEKFENISNRVLKTQQADLEQKQKDGINNIIAPFKKDIFDFKTLIENTNRLNNEDKGYLKKEIDDLKNINYNLNQNTNDLLKALKGNSKIQGDWGENILKNILDMAGFLEGRDYKMQYNIKGENDENLRPDCIIFMPDGKKMIVDSKVSISSYIDYVKTDDPDLAKEFLEKHVTSIKNHIKELATKNYQSYLDGNNLDFVFMFIPNEQAYIEALKINSDIYENAYKSNIAITTPSSILPILRTVKNLWNIEKQNENAGKIAKKAGQLYDKLVGFVDNMQLIDKGINSAKTAYDKAIAQLKTGRGSAISIAGQMKSYGAITTKSLPGEMMDDTIELLEQRVENADFDNNKINTSKDGLFDL